MLYIWLIDLFAIFRALCVTGASFCDPFNKSGCNTTNNIRKILSWMIEKLPQLNSDHKVCDRCCKNISELKTEMIISIATTVSQKIIQFYGVELEASLFCVNFMRNDSFNIVVVLDF
jgi:hypothetical protein